MRASDITDTDITDAINAGNGDIYAIAAHLGVNHTSYTLRSRIKHLADNGTITTTAVAADTTKTYTVTR